MFLRNLFLVVSLVLALLSPDGCGIAGDGAHQAKAKYLFLFIGDGMGVAQRAAAELYLRNGKGWTHPGDARLVMNGFPAQGLNTTGDLSSVIPDSAAAGTAIACGRKTRSIVLGMDAEGKTSYENIAELARKHHRKVGILTTVSLDHATPAAFYAHVPNRRKMYDISMQLAASGVDYFAGGQLMEPKDRNDPGKPDAVETARRNGYSIAVGREGFETLKPGMGKVIAMSGVVDRNAAMYFTLDQGNDSAHVSIAEYLSKAVELLDNPNGFFIMTEGGKIDWACHAHDAAAAVHDTLALDDAVAEAVRFYKKHPEETLIVVTGDHETGGLAIGYTRTGYSSHVELLRHQKMSYIEFEKRFAEYRKTHSPADARLEDLMPLIEDAYGLRIMAAAEKQALEKAVQEARTSGAPGEAKKATTAATEQLKSGMALTDLEIEELREALKQSMSSGKERPGDERAFILYGTEEPLVVKVTTILNNKAGLGWTTFAHTGVPVQTSALGVGAEAFNGYYDQTDIFAGMVDAAGFGMAP